MVFAALLSRESAFAKSYPIIAYGTRTFVAETTQTGGTVLVRVYRRQGSTTCAAFQPSSPLYRPPRFRLK